MQPLAMVNLLRVDLIASHSKSPLYASQLKAVIVVSLNGLKVCNGLFAFNMHFPLLYFKRPCNCKQPWSILKGFVHASKTYVIASQCIEFLFMRGGMEKGERLHHDRFICRGCATHSHGIAAH